MHKQHARFFRNKTTSTTMTKNKSTKRRSWNFTDDESEQWTQYEYVVQCAVVGSRYSDLFPPFFGWFFFFLLSLMVIRFHSGSFVVNRVTSTQYIEFRCHCCILIRFEFIWKTFHSVIISTWYIRMVGRSVGHYKYVYACRNVEASTRKHVDGKKEEEEFWYCSFLFCFLVNGIVFNGFILYYIQRHSAASAGMDLMLGTQKITAVDDVFAHDY